MKTTIFITTLIFVTTIGFGQDTTFVFRPSSNVDSLQNGIVYEEDARVDALLKELKTYEIQGNVVIMDGYRIQVYFSNERKLAEEQRMKFIKLFPQHESFIEYDAPNYTVKVGSFKTLEEAEDFRALITRDFPMSIIQKTKIKMPLDKGNK